MSKWVSFWVSAPKGRDEWHFWEALLLLKVQKSIQELVSTQTPDCLGQHAQKCWHLSWKCLYTSHSTSCICLCSYGMDLLFQAETKIPFHLLPFTQRVFCSVRNKESLCIRNSYHLWFLWRRKMEYLHQRIKKRPNSTDTTGSLHRHQSVTDWGKWNLFACFQIRWSSNSVYQIYHLSSVLTETQLPEGEWEQTKVCLWRKGTYPTI